MKINSLLSSAHARLTDEWRMLSAIKLSPSSGDFGFRDLVWLGMAEEKREPIVRAGILCGERIYFRKAQK